MPPQCEFEPLVEETTAAVLKAANAEQQEKAILKEKVFSIRKVIRAEDRRVRAQHPWLAYQDTLGMAIFLGSILGEVVTGWLYFNGHLGALATIFSMAFFTGILHELEHDLIHDLYFKRWAIVQDLMFFGIWVSKLHANPWWRRTIHLRHHHHSGQKLDIEERLIGLGLPFGWVRLALTINPFASLLITKDIQKDNPNFSGVEMIGLAAPCASWYLVLTITWAMIVTGLWDLVFPALFDISPYWKMFFYDWAIVMCLPNILRQGSLQFISTYVHYYEDLPEGADGLFFQNQILQHPLLWPFQIFCFNFGSTHIIHHYITNQPFYLRQMIASGVHEEMLKQGVRKNDFTIQARANRWDQAFGKYGFFGGLSGWTRGNNSVYFEKAKSQ